MKVHLGGLVVCKIVFRGHAFSIPAAELVDAMGEARRLYNSLAGPAYASLVPASSARSPRVSAVRSYLLDVLVGLLAVGVAVAVGVDVVSHCGSAVAVASRAWHYLAWLSGFLVVTAGVSSLAVRQARRVSIARCASVSV